MTLYELLNGIKHDENIKDCEVVKVTCDNREVVAGTVFVCIKGQKFDGHDVAQKAVESGASLVVCEKDVGLPQQLVVANTREAYGIMCGNFYGNPAGKLKLIGITGTNGKTTISYLVKQLLEDAGVSFAVRVSEVDETLDPDLAAQPEEAAKKLAEKKAGAV
ncbi:MAG: Mur ligase domain-containing protein, partial [Hydrogenoanaerobacterium sp.]